MIAGRYGGRRLRAPRGRTTRPTSERVREALFSMLGDISGAHVLDLFAGSGALGIEALSRGARRSVFVERDRTALAVLRANLAALELDDEQAEVRREDAEAALQTAGKRRETYDLVLIDPPYGRASELRSRLDEGLEGLIAPRGRVVVESDRRHPLRLRLPLQIDKERTYGDTTIAIHTPTPTPTSTSNPNPHPDSHLCPNPDPTSSA